MQSGHNRTWASEQSAAGSTLASVSMATTPSYSASPSGGTLQGATDVASGTGQTIYSYCVSGPSQTRSPANAGYDAVGNVLGYSDPVMGAWSFGNDSLNRMVSGTPAVGNTAPDQHRSQPSFSLRDRRQPRDARDQRLR